MYRKNILKIVTSKLLNKRGEFDPGANDNNGGSDNNANESVIMEALSKMNQRMESIATSLATSKEDKTVNENLKQEILDAYKKELTGKAQENEQMINTLKSDLAKANETIKGYQLQETIDSVVREVKINEDGAKLFSKIVDKSTAFDKEGNIDKEAIKAQASDFIKEYGVFSSKPNSLNVNRTHYQGVGEQSQPDTSKMTLTDALASHYAMQGLN